MPPGNFGRGRPAEPTRPAKPLPTIVIGPVPYLLHHIHTIQGLRDLSLPINNWQNLDGCPETLAVRQLRFGLPIPSETRLR